MKTSFPETPVILRTPHAHLAAVLHRAPGKRFYTDRPKVDTPAAYCALDIPRFQIQGDHDNPGFLKRFTSYCPVNDPLVRHLVLPGADHCFTTWEHRRRVIVESVRWLKKHLA
jgi:hypothetical protein